MKITPEDAIKEALSVRDEGQEPKHDSEVYESALLAVAHREQKPTEDFPTALSRVVRTDNNCDALIFAADRKRDAEAAATSLGKSAPPSAAAPMGKSTSLDAILADAERVSKSGSAPRFTRDAAESAMIELAKREARSGESPCAAFARLCEGDSRMDALYSLGQAADVAEVETVAKAAPPDDRFYPMLLDMASMRKRSGETLDAACARLLAEDPIVRDAYAASQGL
jgi:hypothetical protein